MTGDPRNNQARDRRPLWLVLGAIAVLTVPSLAWLHEPFWRHPLQLSTNGLIVALAFALAGVASQAFSRSGPVRVAVASALFAAGGFAGYALDLLRADIPYAKPFAAVAFALGIGLFGLGELLRGRLRTMVTLVLAAVAGYSLVLAVIDGKTRLHAREPGQPVFVLSAYYPLEIRYHGGIVRPSDVQVGGGIASAGDQFIAVTGAGAFYRLAWAPMSASVSGDKIPIDPPIDAAAFAAAMPRSVNLAHFRVQDVVTRRSADGWEIFATHHVWDAQAKTLSMALSKAVLDANLASVVSGWTQVYRTHPAFPPTRDGVFSGDQSGGRLAWLSDGRLLMTTGDHDFNGWNRQPATSQDAESDYGKTIAIDVATGKAATFTTGHRNPQGLFIDAAQRIWSTEHGPQGGDELNLLTAGGNYGWPLETYGTEYGMTEWPTSAPPPAGVVFKAPIFSWVPSIGVSNLIEVTSPSLDRWRGNLLIASLNAQTLYRAALDGDRVAYVEPIPIGRRIRDVIETPQGDVWLWADTGEVITLTAKEGSRGETVAASCTSCHSLHLAAGQAPSLEHIIGRRVASMDYPYSPALKALGGTWTTDRLDTFLANPGAFAPGTVMTIGVSNPSDRAAVIAYLRDRR